MLNKEEEQKLEQYLTDCTVHIERGYQYSRIFSPIAVYWLAEKLKEANEELKEVRKYLDKYSMREDIEDDKVVKEVILKPEQEQSDTLRNLYSSKNEISDRFYPR